MIVILTALDQELALFQKAADISNTIEWKGHHFYQAELFNKSVVLGKCGVGKVLSAMITQLVIDKFSPEAILFCGLAGALNADLNVGDIVVGKDFIQHDMNAAGLGFKRGHIPYSKFNVIEGSCDLLSIALGYKSSQHQVVSGRILTGDQFLDANSKSSMDYLNEELQGDAVEMEGASVALVCTINEVKFCVVRTISDKADHEAAVSFEKFLPIASENSFEMLEHILNNYDIASSE